MISVSGKQWEERKISKNLVEKLKQDYKFSEIISKLIISRNFDNAEISSIENKPHLINIFKNNSDFNQSINLLCESINKKENICILGDYDVDGSVATSLLVNFFQHIKQPFFYYIPDRVKDGYGASKVLFEKLIKKKPKLIIMVDCGSTSIEAVDFLNKNKIKSIIIDHHEINKPYPKANIIINPKKDNGYIEYNYLCASALVYFFVDLLIKKIESSFDIKKYLIHVLLATVCDVMPLRKLNRFISMSALENFDINENEVFYELYKLSNKNNKINIGDLGFLIGPILNSGGRLGKSSYATELLTSNKYDVIKKRAAELFFLNQKRREIETTIINEVDFKKIADDIPDDEIDEDWKSILESKTYEREIWTIAKTRINSVEMKSLKDKRVELLDGPDEFDFAMMGKYPRDVLENKFKQELLSICAGLLRETGFGANLRGILYQVMLNHIKTKIFSGKTLCDVDDDDIEFAMMSMPDIRKNFTKSIVAGIIGTK